MKEPPATYLLSKYHLQQAIRLIQDQGLQVLQAYRLRVPQVVNEPPLQPLAPRMDPAATSHMISTAFGRCLFSASLSKLS